MKNVLVAIQRNFNCETVTDDVCSLACSRAISMFRSGRFQSLGKCAHTACFENGTLNTAYVFAYMHGYFH